MRDVPVLLPYTAHATAIDTPSHPPQRLDNTAAISHVLGVLFISETRHDQTYAAQMRMDTSCSRHTRGKAGACRQCGHMSSSSSSHSFFCEEGMMMCVVHSASTSSVVVGLDVYRRCEHPA